MYAPQLSPLAPGGRELERGGKLIQIYYQKIKDKIAEAWETQFTISLALSPPAVGHMLEFFSRRTKSVGPMYPHGIFNSPLGLCWAFWKCPCSTVLGSWKGSPERLSKCLGAFHLLNCTTKAVTQAAGLGS